MPSNEYYRQLQNEGLGRHGFLQVLWYFALGGLSATAVGIGFGKMVAWANDETDTSDKKDKKKVEKYNVPQNLDSMVRSKNYGYITT